MMSNQEMRMHQFPLSSLMINVLICFLICCVNAQAGVVVGGTRFVYPEKQSSISVELKNTASKDMLVKISVTPDDGRQLNGTVESQPLLPDKAFIATPPLLVLKQDKNTKIRINRVDGQLPTDRESLFILNVAALPAQEQDSQLKHENQLHVAVRNRMKIFYRPEALSGNPLNAYQQLRWSRSHEAVTVFNPTPWYVTLYNLSIDGKNINSGMVAPFSHRQQNWCQGQGYCEINWQTLDLYNNALPVWSVKLNVLQNNAMGTAAIHG
ncbi:pilin chaperone [Escherichia sp. E2748]|nr:pilin chaperone [Escherichia sp. E2748]